MKKNLLTSVLCAGIVCAIAIPCYAAVSRINVSTVRSGMMNVRVDLKETEGCKVANVDGVDKCKSGSCTYRAVSTNGKTYTITGRCQQHGNICRCE